jgi:hypothetical protein
MGKTRNNKTAQRPRTQLGTWKAKFLASLRRMGNVSRALKAAGVGRQTAYDHRDRDPNFARQWAEALEQAADWLEREAWRRAVKGTDRPVFQQGGRVGTVRDYSDTLLIHLLKAHKPEKYRDRVEHTGARRNCPAGPKLACGRSPAPPGRSSSRPARSWTAGTSTRSASTWRRSPAARSATC